MNRFRTGLYRFMAGRYGVDKLYYVLIVLYLILTFSSSIFHVPALFYVSFAVLGIAIFRFLSRNITRRRAENQMMLRGWRRFIGFFKLTANRFRDRKTKRYKKCPHCKSILRLPKKKGKHTVNCPRCKKDFTMRIRF